MDVASGNIYLVRVHKIFKLFLPHDTQKYAKFRKI